MALLGSGEILQTHDLSSEKPTAWRCEGRMTLALRPVREEDRARVVEISAQIWDGEDYVPDQFSAWIAESEGEVIGAEIDGRLIAFARRTWLCPGQAWLEGIRTDPAYRGRGAGKAITEYLIESARRAGALTIHLSTHVGNEASIHIIESFGFRRVASFVHLERTIPETAHFDDSADDIIEVSAQETAGFAARSRFLASAGRLFPRGWRFVPFDLDPLEAVARLGTRIGIRRAGTLTSLLCLRQPVGTTTPTVMNFGDGDPQDLERLLEYAHARYAGRHVEAMVPQTGEETVPLLRILLESGYETWENETPDVFSYQLDLR